MQKENVCLKLHYKISTMTENIDEYPDRLQDNLKDKTLFITGGSGFLGKVLIEKLLRCMEVKRIYILLREKKGKEPKQRIRELFQNPLFDTVRKQKGEKIFEKCTLIAGDVSIPDLGMSAQDRETLINEVEFVVHSAATIRFDDPMKKAVLLNVRGTKLVLELAAEMKKLLIYVHVSTSYCHLSEKILYEKAYPAHADPHYIIKTVEHMDEKLVESITPTLLGTMPNTYAFTKNLSESLCVEQLDKLPIIILRPSVVIPIWKDPLPGWTDNINGPTGLLIGAGKGVIRTMYCNSDRYADFMPVDIVANSLVACMWDGVANKLVRRFYNLCSSAEYKVSYEEIINLGKQVVYERIPFNGVMWYPGGSMTKYRLLHQIRVLLYHYLPAVFIDTLLFCLGYKPILWRIQQRITKGFEVFEYYANNQWDFNNDTSMAARSQLNPKERQKYKLDGNGISYLDYFTDCTHACRLYILKETDDTIPAAKRHMRM
ncbi:male sterility protein 2-related [Holotrichia oblita]|uniref:Male sterility protein 2-related n=1 Tax=Holotrichia oblita TaxID=644536 RepID=A0ACB9SLD7_HOLOL|nr:male sterility protein 2-related [Holotrichia oblita]